MTPHEREGHRRGDVAVPVMRPERSRYVVTPLLSRVTVPVVRPAPSSPHGGRADFRAWHGDQFGRRGSRPEQAKRDQGGEADYPMRRIFIPHLGKMGLAYFSPTECEVAHTSRALTVVIKLRPARARHREGRWRVIPAGPCSENRAP